MEESTDWESTEHMFLVCVFNVSPDQPYTMFQAPVTSTAQDIITQVRLDYIGFVNFIQIQSLKTHFSIHQIYNQLSVTGILDKNYFSGSWGMKAAVLKLHMRNNDFYVLSIFIWFWKKDRQYYFYNLRYYYTLRIRSLE